MKRCNAGLILLVLFSVVGQANAAILGGNPTIERTTVDGAENALFFDLTSPISAAGTIDSWRVYANVAHWHPPAYNITSYDAQLKLKIFRDVGDTWQFIGESPLETVTAWGAVNTFILPTPIDVQAGDLIAWYYPVGTTPSIALDYGGGQGLINSGWSVAPLGDIDYDIPDLIGNPDWNGGWAELNRTYSIEVLGSFAVPEPSTLAIWGALGGLGLIAARRRRKRVA